MHNYKNLFINADKHLQNELIALKKKLQKQLLVDNTMPRSACNQNSTDDELLERYNKITDDGGEPLSVFADVISRLCEQIPNWNSPYLHYNVGAPVNSIATMAYAFALENNIFTINDGLAGKTLIAERAVLEIVSTLANLAPQTTCGWFTFGGTATNLYGLKVGIKKADPQSAKQGTSKRLKVFTTANAHFGQFVSTEWLGVGTDNIIVVQANEDGTTNIDDFEAKLETELKQDALIACIYANGGTSYSHVIDDIDQMVKIRNKLTVKYKLNYQPHIHVDSVIGWFWLFFQGYDFIGNPLSISADSLQKLKEQYQRIAQLKFADSWGVDFHKGIGGCPVDSSLFILNNEEDALLLSKQHSQNMHLHQIANEFSSKSL